ncbi:MAG TPA: tetraacyldisaccharide 4'-kinase [Rhizomicrobium sp.]|jgi:tetraacyldisaccharide 4'-kinase|nr:tetraacyldisaccharide 4'-kinase [Rhizomicrobium sp.]
MREPEFWSRNSAGARWTAALLAPLGLVHGASVAWKYRLRRSYCARVPVICVGNLTVGGAGKTPLAIAIARMLQDKGVSPVFLSRGYGRKTSDAVMVDTKSHDASRVGDEALLLACVAPTVVATDRAKGARIAEAEGAEAIIMDDGHQNFSLEKRLSLLVVDGETGLGNGKVFPAGPLREPARQGLRRADAVIVMGDGDPHLPDFHGPLFRARLSPERHLDGTLVAAFAGIGRPQKFFTTLREAGAALAMSRAYPDHHTYTPAEIAQLKDRAAQMHAALITTEKDFVRLDPRARERIEVLAVRAVFEDEAALRRLFPPFYPKAAAVR